MEKTFPYTLLVTDMQSCCHRIHRKGVTYIRGQSASPIVRLLGLYDWKRKRTRFAIDFDCPPATGYIVAIDGVMFTFLRHEKWGRTVALIWEGPRGEYFTGLRAIRPKRVGRKRVGRKPVKLRPWYFDHPIFDRATVWSCVGGLWFGRPCGPGERPSRRRPPEDVLIRGAIEARYRESLKQPRRQFDVGVISRAVTAGCRERESAPVKE